MKNILSDIGEKIKEGFLSFSQLLKLEYDITLEDVIEGVKANADVEEICKIIDAIDFWIVVINNDDVNSFVSIEKKSGVYLDYDIEDITKMNCDDFRVIWEDGTYVDYSINKAENNKTIQYIRTCDRDYFEIGMGVNGNVFLRNAYTEIPNMFKMYDQEEVNKLFYELCEELYKRTPITKVYGENEKSYLDVLYTDGTEATYEKPVILELYSYSEFHGEFTFFDGEYSKYATIARLKQVCRDKQEKFSVFKKVIEDIEIGTDEYEKLVVTDLSDGSVSLEVMIILQGNICHEKITINQYGYIEETGKSKYAELLKKYQVRIIR